MSVQDTVFGFDTYPVEIKNANGIVHLFCKRLGVIVSDQDLQKAYEKLNHKRKEVLEQLNMFGLHSVDVKSTAQASLDNKKITKDPIEIVEHNGMFYVLCNTLGILEADTSLEKAYAKLNAKRLEMPQLLELFGHKASRIKLTHEKKSDVSTLVKYVLIVVLCFVPVGFIAGYGYVTNKVTAIIAKVQNNFKQRLARTLGDPSQVVVALNHVSKTLDKVTPERKEEIKLTLRKIVSSLQPYADEIKPLYVDK